MNAPDAYTSSLTVKVHSSTLIWMERSVLLVDDDEQLLRGVRRVLEARTRVFTATSTTEACAIVEEQALDVAIVDHRLGREDGIDAIRLAKARQPNCRILLLSGYATTEVTVEAMRAGAHDVKNKPVRPSDILHWIEENVWALHENSIATLERVIWEHIRRAIVTCGGNQSEAARKLGISRSRLRRYLHGTAPRR